MGMLKGRRRNSGSAEGNENDSIMSFDNDDVISTSKNDHPLLSSYPSFFRRTYGIESQESDYDLASLAYTESDDGTSDSSDDSYIYGGQSTEIRRRHGHQQNEVNTVNVIDNDIDEEKPVHHCEVGKYMASRVMTPFQEFLNALTVLPSTYFCIMFFLSGSWLSQSFIQEYANAMVDNNEFDDSQCITSSRFPHVYALPPLSTIAVALGVFGHAPFSMIYHLKCAHSLPPGLPRTIHWSRRMDQVMIHVQSAFFAYASTGRLDFFLANVIFNMDCIYRQSLPKVVPRRNQVRLGMSILFYTLPFLVRGEFSAFLQLAVIFATCGWLFGMYPIGGWSHAVFHIACTLVPPIMFSNALNLPSSQRELEVAAHCARLAEKVFES